MGATDMLVDAGPGGIGKMDEELEKLYSTRGGECYRIYRELAIGSCLSRPKIIGGSVA